MTDPRTDIVAKTPALTVAPEHVETFKDVGKLIDDVISIAVAAWKAVVKGVEQFAIFWGRSQLFQQAGWLPHPAAPFDEIPIDIDADEVSARLEAYYRDHWAQVRWTFNSRIQAYDIDPQAKATFADALTLHEGGHYRAVVQLLFPEIERVACKEIYLGDQYERRADGKKDGLITSLKSLRQAAGEQLGMSDFGDLRFALSLFQRMSEHLYEKVGDDPASIAEYAADSVPNRHAALHGLVIYQSVKNSINMLIMADFMFGIIHALKRVHARHALIDASAASEAPVEAVASLIG